MLLKLKILVLIASTLYQAIVCYQEDRTAPPGQLMDVGGYRLHLHTAGVDHPNRPTIVLDHSLGGIEGYFLIDELAKLGRVCIYDRAGYGWSDRSPHPRTGDRIVTELDILLTQAGIQPPYLLVGDSFGTYNVRLYAHRFPDKVLGLVLTDGLHESGMLKMSLSLKALKLVFISGFLMSTLGALLGIIRILRTVGAFELLKPELREIPKETLDAVKRSFCRPKHWITMSQELLGLDSSGHQLRDASHLGTLPIVSIKAASFFMPSLWTRLIPLEGTNQLREKMHIELNQLSTQVIQLEAGHSSHFVWVDQPDVIVKAVKILFEKLSPL